MSGGDRRTEPVASERQFDETVQGGHDAHR
jgi:hypothetical protein